MMNANNVNHLELIQNVINRMSNNSFLIKGWSITLIASLFALSIKDSNQNYIYISFIPLTMFWILDGYLLYQERLYRALYDEVRAIKVETDFSMKTREFEGEKTTWSRSVFSKTLNLFYFPLLIINIIVIFLK